MQNDVTKREVLISSLREFGVLLLKISIEKSILAPQKMDQATITELNSIVEGVIEIAFNDRDIRYKPLADYLWDSIITKDHRIDTMLQRWADDCEDPHGPADFYEEMKLTLARRIFDYYYGAP